MKSFNFKTTLSIILITTQISCAQRKGKYYTVSGTVTTTSSYCGGAAPSEEMLARLSKPTPVTGKQLFIKPGKENSKNVGVIKTVTTDSLGRFQINLKSGVYCIVEESKSKALVIPTNDKYSQWDEQCLTEKYVQCDYQLNVSEKNVSDVNINFHKSCSYSLPCLQYSGPLPPSAPHGK